MPPFFIRFKQPPPPLSFHLVANANLLGPQKMSELVMYTTHKMWLRRLLLERALDLMNDYPHALETAPHTSKEQADARLSSYILQLLDTVLESPSFWESMIVYLYHVSAIEQDLHFVEIAKLPTSTSPIRQVTKWRHFYGQRLLDDPQARTIFTTDAPMAICRLVQSTREAPNRTELAQTIIALACVCVQHECRRRASISLALPPCTPANLHISQDDNGLVLSMKYYMDLYFTGYTLGNLQADFANFHISSPATTTTAAHSQ
jgi:hypothetical protein